MIIFGVDPLALRDVIEHTNAIEDNELDIPGLEKLSEIFFEDIAQNQSEGFGCIFFFLINFPIIFLASIPLSQKLFFWA
ncbi:hypothetical protein SLEP1_g24822 [Rubroshorea leprosula]|uniref:Uncharacterized protein n=1 Tax=Rubroshorea leprosula TaxID=152421 RepID=A0AAV5JGS2_9ROSI|nr:hypothetical protein SLEP1_g24822 [Rubroshorea leprosula]